VTDLVMSLWFAELGIRDRLKRSPSPMYSPTQHVPMWKQGRRRIWDPGTGQVWAPSDPSMPDFGRLAMANEPHIVELANMAKSITVY
jgi:hypothetical protein